MRRKVEILNYWCKKCNKSVYFRSDEEYSTQCKACKNEMQFKSKNDYRPKSALRAVNDSNIKQKNNTNDFIAKKLTVECPYCNSTDTKKISTTSRVFSTSLFGLGSKKLGKQWHCNKCRSDF